MARLRSFTLTLDSATNTALTAYMDDNGLATKAEAARELIMTTLASMPDTAHLVAAKNKAYIETKRFILTKAVEFFAGMQTEITNSLQELDRAG